MRLSPSSQLLLLAVGLAIVMTGLAGAIRPRPTPSPVPSVSAGTTSPAPIETPASTATPTTGQTGTSTTGPTAIPTTAPTATPASVGEVSLRDLLAMLLVAGEDRTGYERSLFTHWIDADGDGCDTRREVLIDEAIDAPTVGAGCSLSGGRWRSLYDGVATTDPGTFDVDHVVALAEAWDSGARGWSRDRRTRFANDLDVDWALIAVSAGSNRSKSDKDPADWLPPLADARCEYLGMWLAVKVRWSLSIDAIERRALDREISGCPQRMPVVRVP